MLMDSKYYHQAGAGSLSSPGNFSENNAGNTLDLTLRLGLSIDQPGHVNLPVPMSLPDANSDYAKIYSQPQGVSNNKEMTIDGEGHAMVNRQAQVHGKISGMNYYGTILKGGNNSYGEIQNGLMAKNRKNNNGGGGADNFHGGRNFAANQMTRSFEEMLKYPFYRNLLGSQCNVRDPHHNNNFNISRPSSFEASPITSQTMGNYTLLDTCPRRVHREFGNPSFFGLRNFGEQQQCGVGIYNNPNKRCTNYNCNTNDTPMWRRGPLGPKSLCNACGIKYRKNEEKKRARAAATAAANDSNGDNQKACRKRRQS